MFLRSLTTLLKTTLLASLGGLLFGVLLTPLVCFANGATSSLFVAFVPKAPHNSLVARSIVVNCRLFVPNNWFCFAKRVFRAITTPEGGCYRLLLLSCGCVNSLLLNTAGPSASPWQLQRSCHGHRVGFAVRKLRFRTEYCAVKKSEASLRSGLAQC